MDGKATLRIVNLEREPRTIVLEPWTGEYTLQPGKEFSVVAEGDTTRPLTFEMADGRLYITTFDSAGARMSIFQDGQEILHSE